MPSKTGSRTPSENEHGRPHPDSHPSRRPRAGAMDSLRALVEPPLGIKPQTYALRVRRTSAAPCAPSPSVHVTRHTVLIESHGRTPFEATKEATTEIHGADGAPAARRARGCESAHGLGCPSNDGRAGERASAGGRRRVAPD